MRKRRRVLWAYHQLLELMDDQLARVAATLDRIESLRGEVERELAQRRLARAHQLGTRA